MSALITSLPQQPVFFLPDGHAYFLDHNMTQQVPSVSAICDFLTEEKENMRAIPKHYAERGTYLHGLTEKWDRGEIEGPEWELLEENDEEAARYLFGWVGFCDSEKIEAWSGIEAQFAACINGLWVAGTIDRFLPNAVYDFKSSRVEFYKRTGEPKKSHRYACQLALYQLILGLPDNATAATVHTKGGDPVVVDYTADMPGYRSMVISGLEAWWFRKDPKSVLNTIKNLEGNDDTDEG